MSGRFTKVRTPEVDLELGGVPTSRPRQVLVLLPAYNEGEAIEGVISSILSVSEEMMNTDVEILVIDGQSRDETRSIARESGARVVVQPGKGKGNAVRFGISMSGPHSAVVMLDADGSYPAEQIPEFLRELEHGADMVVGSRILGTMEEGAMPALHLIGNRLLSSLARVIYGKRISDICSGMWAFTTVALEGLNLNANHFELEAELFAQASKAELILVEIPIAYRRRTGKPKLGSLRAGFAIAMKLLRKRFVP